MCEFIDNNNNKCCKKQKYGEYCWKHRYNYLLDDNKIIYDRFTFKQSDYSKDIIILNLKFNNIICKNSEKKQELFDKYVNFINVLKKYNTDDIIKIQKFYKKKYNNKVENIRGEGYNNRLKCSNSEDFFTFDPCDKIKCLYFISYKDNNGLIWGFDLRSVDKLLETSDKNPYTREKFPREFLERIKLLKNKLKKLNVKLNYNSEIIKERKANIKQLTVDLFSDIEILGYDCNINWYLNLNLDKLKKLYRILEDIWNWRAQLTPEMKRNLVPPHGRLFIKPLFQVNRMTNKRELQELIINDISKFQTAITQGDKVTGYLWFLFGLSHVSIECYNSYSHLHFY